ncbi:sensor histidine kinase [Metabacillus malikii]|uniref:LytT family two-component system sensor histidine kinase NatK n=1 Tax=Metabacillus malikii TaxID=1504265 RepID=A0ABT9ZDN9_9BACI|nr:GHKL domain-containing protein [Metabacillus malikii]MDQ0230383.1 LytT family two-component system sensor histidine kinase NatK [Metabacillus malikii]
MKNSYYTVIIVLIHVASWFTIIYRNPQIVSFILLGVTLSLAVYYREKLKQLPILLKTLPGNETIFITLLQVTFLSIVVMSVNFNVQLLSMIGILVGELYRIFRYPEMVKQKDTATKYEMKIKEMNEHFLTIRSQRHDFLKHVSAIDYLIGQDAGDEVKQYFRNLLGDYEKVNRTIKGEEVHISSILLKYKIQAEQAGVKATYNLTVPVSTLPLSKIHQVQLVTNLLENAVEAAQSYFDKAGTAKLELNTDRHGGIFILEVKNSAYIDDKGLLDNLFTKFEVSSKGGHHQGLGTYIISNIVKSHNGRITYQFLNNELSIRVKLPLIKNATIDVGRDE